MTRSLPVMPAAASDAAMTPFFAVSPGCSCLARKPPWLVSPEAMEAASEIADDDVARSNPSRRAQAADEAMLPSVMVLSQPRR